MLVFGDRRWITNLHYAFQDNTNLVSLWLIAATDGDVHEDGQHDGSAGQANSKLFLISKRS